MVEGTPPGTPFRHPHSEQRRPTRAHAVGPVLGPHARTDRTRDTRVAEPWPPAQEDGRPGEGQRLTPDAPHNGGRPPPPGTAPRHPRGTQPPQGTQAKGTVLGPHTHTPAPTARGWRTPTARPVGGQSGEGQRLTSRVPTARGQRAPTAPRRRAAGGGRAPGLATGPPRTAGGGAPSAHTHTRMPACGTDVRAPAPTPRRAHSTCTSHGKSAPHPLLLGTATQQWRNPRPHAKHAPDLRR